MQYMEQIHGLEEIGVLPEEMRVKDDTPKQVRAIPKELQSQIKSLNKLGEQIETLKARLGPILSQVPEKTPTEGTSGQPKPVIRTVAGEIKKRNAMIENLSEKVHHLIGRIEL